ncbi:hypothetical protein PN36_14555 [Candidatus Thiomargarita nelsonii]|uniref:ATPase domain protein, prokaryote domain protein n=1 Tax=Candidatus Thiomargarita nelsonii TaxID=1003181 RepID=A0A0A6RYJ2_9GAMM|nr:hypothetical protein PN36_14555 [Candidatus Thiomargarita nelsonii]
MALTLNEIIKMKSHPQEWAIKPLVPEEIYTDREDFLDYFYRAALNARHRRTMSTVLLGQRRMGKTEIFKRVINRLFFEQDHHAPKAVIPIYYSFQDNITDRWDFAKKYVENFIRWYVAFRLRDKKILSVQTVKWAQLRQIIHNQLTMTEGFEGAIEFLESLLDKEVIIPEQAALSHPRQVSDYDDSTIVVFLDEFQNTRLPHYNFDVVGYMQEAVESPTCPHFVTGSAMSILAREILGRGSLFGRFDNEPIEGLTGYFGAELTAKAAKYYQATLSPEIAPVVAQRCGGNPFYITAVVRQAAKQGMSLSDEQTLNTLLAVDLSSGFIWNELSDQVNRWIERINDYGITKWVLYLSALEEGEEIDIKRIQQQLFERDGQKIPPERIKEVLIKLSRGDLIDYKEFGGWFGKVNDPILLDFLKVWGKIEVERQDQGRVKEDLQIKYSQLKRKVSDLKGYLAEVYMAQILLNAQRRSLPGRYFHQENDIEVPDFTYVRLREKLGPGSHCEIDVHGGAGIEQWVGESKWIAGRKSGINEIKILLDKAEVVRKDRDAELVRVWFFDAEGFSKKAMILMQEKGVFWSTKEDLDGLLDYVKLRRLPTL